MTIPLITGPASEINAQVQAALAYLGANLNPILGGLRIFNVVSYGADPTGVADSLSAFNLAIADFNSAGGGRLYFPAGIYKISGAITAITGNGIVEGDGMAHSDSSPTDAATRINCTSQTAVCFTANAYALTFRDFSLVNTYAGTPTSASRGIDATNSNSFNSQSVNFESISVWGFYINVDVLVGAYWHMVWCRLFAAVEKELQINNTVNADAGDAVIAFNLFQGEIYDSGPAVQVNGSGGIHFVHNKVNGYLHYHSDGINIAAAATGLIIIDGFSCENITGTPVYGDNTGGGTWHGIQIGHCQFNQSPVVANTKNGIFLKGISDITISDIVFEAASSTGAAAIFLDNCTNAAIDEDTLVNSTVVGSGFGRLVQSVNGYSGPLLPGEDTAALTVSSNTVTPIFKVSHVGAGTINTISAAVPIADRRAFSFRLVADGVVTFGTSGNIAKGFTVGADEEVTITYTPTTGKFYIAGTDTGAWSTYAPTIGAGSGSFTTVSASVRYKAIGKMVHISVEVVITTNGTAGTYVSLTLPVTDKNSMAQNLAASNQASTNITARIAGGNLFLLSNSGGYPGGTGVTLTASGSYEAA